MNRIELEQEARHHLRALGDSAKQIAKSLRKKKIKGKQASMRMCPIASYLKSVLPDETYVVACSDYISVRLPSRNITDSGVVGWLRPSREIERFIIGFDCGRFPELEK